MKNFKSTILICALVLMTSQLSFSQEFKKLDKSPMDVASFPASYKISDKTVKVTYSRPQLKGRALTKLVPSGEVWRTGANEAAQITFYKPMMAGKTLIKPGTYSLFTIPGQKEWTVIINSEINLWGAYYYNQKYDVARMQATISKGETEAFSIAFTEANNGIEMHLGWGTIIATTNFTNAVE
jgi:hypothetical protein